MRSSFLVSYYRDAFRELPESVMTKAFATDVPDSCPHKTPYFSKALLTDILT